MRRLVLKADLSVDGYLGRDGADADWAREHYDEELTRYQARVVQKAGVHALEAEWSVDALAELKQEGGHVELAPIVAEGGSRFCLELSRRRLVDEYRVVVHPVVFGEGDPLFAVADRFYLIGTNFFGTGSLAHTYIPVDAYRDRPPPYPWSTGTQGPSEDDDDPEPDDTAESPAPG
jgi:riboflavin biosynthesis pyrimidine reductase